MPKIAFVLIIIYVGDFPWYLSYFLHSSARHDYLTGCFALYRNQPYLLALFRQSRDYQKVLTEHLHFCFDETNIFNKL